MNVDCVISKCLFWLAVTTVVGATTCSKDHTNCLFGCCKDGQNRAICCPYVVPIVGIAAGVLSILAVTAVVCCCLVTRKKPKRPDDKVRKEESSIDMYTEPLRSSEAEENSTVHEMTVIRDSGTGFSIGESTESPRMSGHWHNPPAPYFPSTLYYPPMHHSPLGHSLESIQQHRYPPYHGVPEYDTQHHQVYHAHTMPRFYGVIELR